MRLDQYLSNHFGFSRNKAQYLIKSWLVFADDTMVRKSSFDVSDKINITIWEDNRVRWVARSAQKLFGFLAHHTDIADMIAGAYCLDVGASTGGFTQVLLEHEAFRVDSVDVGHWQLADIIKADERVHSFEDTDIRDFKPDKPYDIIVSDVSFISLEKILASLVPMCNETTVFILLFKPQFEVGKDFLTKTGLPKNEKIVQQSLQNFRKFLENKHFHILYEEKSILMGEAGNQEWIFCLQYPFKKFLWN